MELTLNFFQHYWWAIMSLLGGILVFMLFVQGGQSLLRTAGRTDGQRTLLVNALGTKWKLGFTTLVTFGGAFFASFPIFYSTSFGGAFYLWMLILLLFVLQGVSYEFRSKAGNLFGARGYEFFLAANGYGGALLLGVAVGTFFTGGHFTVNPGNMGGFGGDVAISHWTSPWRGLEALADWRNLALGLAVVFLARCLALQYFLNNVDDEAIEKQSRKALWMNVPVFLVFFLAFAAALVTMPGFAVDPDTGDVALEKYKYLHNLIEMPAVGIAFLLGVVAVLAGFVLDLLCGSRKGIWWSGAGVIVTVTALLLTAGYNHTAYYPSLSDLQSSLTIANSSSSRFTLQAMSYVSLLIPLVVAYIWYVWRSMNRRRLTSEEVARDAESY